MESAVSAVGNWITYQGQDFRCIAVTPHENARHVVVPVSTWEAVCAEPGCSTPFHQTFPPAFPRSRKTESFALNRRCPLHVNPGVKVHDTVGGAVSEAIEWLVGVLRTEMRTAEISAVVGAADYLPADVARTLGRNRPTDRQRVTYLVRKLRAGENKGVLVSRKTSMDTYWRAADTVP